MTYHDLATTFPELICKLEEMTCTAQNGEKGAHVGRLKAQVRKTDFTITTTKGPLVVHGWKFPEFSYYPEKHNLPCRARGLFTSSEGIIARGYDKFFNIGEAPSLTEPRLAAACSGPFNASTKENGCIIFFAGLEDSTLVVCSKNVTGDYVQDAQKVSHYMRGHEEIERQLARIGKTKADFASTLYQMNATAVAELCDDDFEEHILEYTPDIAGLYLHGINKNTAKLRTAPASEVSAFGTEWGFRNVDQLHFDTFEELMAFLHERAKTGTFENREIEGFVVRCKRDGDDFFFKYKFEQPYLLYRQFREATNKVYSPRYATRTTREVIALLLQFQLTTLAYLDFVGNYFTEHPEAREEFENQHGIVKIRKLFLRHLGLGDSDGIKALEMDGSEKLSEKLDKLVQSTRTVYCVFTIAAPGCGKSTVCRTLAGLSDEWSHFENDDFQKGPLFIKEILTSLNSKKMCFVDRMNYRERYRADLFRKIHEERGAYLLPDVEIKFIGVNFLGSGVTEETKRILLQRLIDRGDNHQSIQAASNPKQAQSILLDVLHSYDGPVAKDEDGFRRVVPGSELTKADTNFAFVINLETEKDSSLENAKIVYRELSNAYSELQVKGLTDQTWTKSYKEAREYVPKNKKKVSAPQRKVEYYGIRIHKDTVLSCLESVLREDPTWQELRASNRVQSEFHVTLAHASASSLSANKESWNQLARIFHKNEVRKTASRMEKVPVDILCDVKIKRIVVVAKKLIALEVSHDGFSEKVQGQWIERKEGLPRTNKHLHITIGTVSPLVKPMMSNVYLEQVHTKHGGDEITLIDWEFPLENQKAFLAFN